MAKEKPVIAPFICSVNIVKYARAKCFFYQFAMPQIFLEVLLIGLKKMLIQPALLVEIL